MSGRGADVKTSCLSQPSSSDATLGLLFWILWHFVIVYLIWYLPSPNKKQKERKKDDNRFAHQTSASQVDEHIQLEASRNMNSCAFPGPTGGIRL